MMSPKSGEAKARQKRCAGHCLVPSSFTHSNVVDQSPEIKRTLEGPENAYKYVYIYIYRV